MSSQRATLYRSLLRELRHTVAAPRKINKGIVAQFRSVAEKLTDDSKQDFENAVNFIRAQREHKRLLARYNPTFDLTSQERVKATARRVGLDMPVTYKPDMHTQILHCDPTAIHFLDDDEPQISCPETLAALTTAAHHLVERTDCVVFPTETVYGLGALALDPTAAAKIFATKGRPPDNPLIVHVSSLPMLHTLLPPGYTIPPAYTALIRHFWPGPLTLLFPRHPPAVPALVSAGQPAVAVRLPAHPVARALIALARAPLAAPSANSSGKPSPTRAEHVARDLTGRVPLILDAGPCAVGLESTVVDGLHPDGHLRVLRPGGVTVEDLERVLREERVLATDGSGPPRVLVHRRDYADEQLESAPTTPGMKYRHYSPAVPVVLLCTRSAPSTPPPSTVPAFLASLPARGVSKIGVLAPSSSPIWDCLSSVPSIAWTRFPLGRGADDLAAVARGLFDGLLSLEAAGVQMMLVEEVTEEREGLAVMNRVRKAASEVVVVGY